MCGSRRVVATSDCGSAERGEGREKLCGRSANMCVELLNWSRRNTCKVCSSRSSQWNCPGLTRGEECLFGALELGGIFTAAIVGSGLLPPQLNFSICWQSWELPVQAAFRKWGAGAKEPASLLFPTALILELCHERIRCDRWSCCRIRRRLIGVGTLGCLRTLRGHMMVVHRWYHWQ